MVENCVYKSIVLCRIVEFYNNIESCGPIFNILQIAKRYGLLDMIGQSVYSGVYFKRAKWKLCVKQSIKEYEHRRHIITATMYCKLGLYRSTITYFAMSPWWVHASRYPHERSHVVLLFRIVVGVQLFEKDGNYNGRNKCGLCNNFSEGSLQHVLYECTCLRDVREKEMREITKYCPRPFIQYYSDLSLYDKTCFILNSFGCKTYVREFHDIFSFFGMFVTNMVQHNLQLSDIVLSTDE